jgi:hypothetical protein
MNRNKLTITLRLTSTGRYPDKYGMEKETTETLCEIEDQHLTASMMGAALRALADEIDPKRAGSAVQF